MSGNSFFIVRGVSFHICFFSMLGLIFLLEIGYELALVYLYRVFYYG